MSHCLNCGGGVQEAQERICKRCRDTYPTNIPGVPALDDLLDIFDRVKQMGVMLPGGAEEENDDGLV
jgi:hypothetical protein